MQHKTIEPGSPGDWMRHAESDLELSKKKESPKILYEELCFHAQQAAEKSIKAVLIQLKIEFPRTHNIKILTEKIPGEHVNIDLFDKIAILTDYAVAMRYPGNYEEISEDEWKEAVELATQTVRWADKLITDMQ